MTRTQELALYILDVVNCLNAEGVIKKERSDQLREAAKTLTSQEEIIIGLRDALALKRKT